MDCNSEPDKSHKMPFKLRLKKSRHYSVVSKSLFIISVEALDNTYIECTLSSESTGQECLECACQKLSVNQPHFFGLQYLSRDGPEANTLCWLEMDRPVKRQLDKHAARMLLHMRVMFYIISGVRLISDELTRYHYFLQLKMDVIEGRIVCNPKQAVQLASYCMQAEFGNYDAEKHTLEYLKDFQLFPKNFTDPAMLNSLTNAAIHQHAALHNLPQGTAEEHFITTCQQLEGYGIETFSAHDSDDNEVMLGISLTGISVGNLDGRSSKFFGWMDVSNVVNHKRSLSLECTVPTDSMQFYFTDIDSAKRAFRMAVLQNTFFRKYEMSGNFQGQSAMFHQSYEDKCRQQENLEVKSVDLVSHHNIQAKEAAVLELSQRAQSTSCLDLTTPTDVDKLRNLLPSYRPAPDYETAVQQKYRNSASALPVAAAAREPQRTTHSFLYSSQPEIHQPHVHYPDVTHNAVYNANYTPQNRNVLDLAKNMHLLHLYKPPPPYPSNRLSSNSTPDLAASSQLGKPQALFIGNQVSGSSPDLVSGGTFLNHHYFKQCGQVLFQPQSVHASQSYLPARTHGTYENLASVFDSARAPQAAVIVDDANITKHMQKMYDEHGNIIYCMPAGVERLLQEGHSGFVVAANQTDAMPDLRQKLNSSTEPIYENIPVTWQNEEGRIRSRTQSIQSAPEVSPTSRENLYANIGAGGKSPKADVSELTAGCTSGHPTDRTQPLPTSTEHNTDSLSRKNTYTIHKIENVHLDSSMGTFNDSGNSTAETSVSTPTNSSSTSKKRRRWGILVGRSRSGDKEKSATLGREKNKNKEERERYRWSTGLPRLQPLPPTISKETMCQLLEQKLSDSQLFFEFDKIPKKKPNSDFKTALQPMNAQFNRFKDVLPYEDNRVRLTATRDNKSGYINASHITATVGSKQRFYIAAQGPTSHTLPSFWHCVWETEVYLVVQLTDATEDLNYLPASSERCVDIGQYQVWWELSQRTGHCVTSKVRLCHVQSRRYRAIWHLHYTDWGDQGCPHSVAHYLGFLEELRSVRQHTMSEIPPGHNKNPPVLVHCTAGVGRTGLTILSDLLLYTIDHNQELNIPRVVLLLRHQRAYMVQTIAQYRFVYTLLIHYLKQTRLI